MALNNVTIQRQNGGIPGSLPGQDHYSGFLMFVGALPTPDNGVVGFSATKRIIPISTIEYAESLGIKADATDWKMKALHYHLKECFRINPAIVLWVGLFAVPTSTYDYSEIKKMQIFADGNLRQIAVYTPDVALSAAAITAMQGVATALEGLDTPLSILYAPKVASIADLDPLAGIGQKNVSVVISQDGDPDGVAYALFNEEDNTNSVTTIGNALGMLSKVKVNESIAWVQKCPSGIGTPGFSDGSLVKETDSGVLSTLNDDRYIFLRAFAGLTGSFYNDNATMDVVTSDYNSIDRVRVMDKAARGVRTYLLPFLSSPVYVDAESGQLRADTVAVLETAAGTALEQMERDGELSGFKAYINPGQNVLASGTIEVVIQQVPVGVMRKINVKIGFTTKLG